MKIGTGIHVTKSQNTIESQSVIIEGLLTKIGTAVNKVQIETT